MKQRKVGRHCFGWVLSVTLTACSFAPPFAPPDVPVPDDYKEVGPWVEAKPHFYNLDEVNQPWWEIFKDPVLNALEQKVECSNNNLKIAIGRYDDARAIAQITASGLYPNIEMIATIARQKDSLSVNPLSTTQLTHDNFLISGILTYELDAWGRVRNSVIASDSLARASGFDVATMQLSLQTQLANDYFQLRGLDEMQCVLDATVSAYKKALYLTRKRYTGGIVAIADVDAATAQLENAKTVSAKNHIKREQMEHAIAVLVGEAPALFDLIPTKNPMHLATIAPELPSTLLTQRPDIAASIEHVQAANAQIGVARAAFFPQFNLFNLIGFNSTHLADLFKRRNLLWSLGPSTALSLIQPEISQPIFEGFKLLGQLHKAKADYFETVYQYRQTVLDAFREVEDSLTAIHRLDEAKASQSRATKAAKGALYQSMQQYKGGLVTFIEVVVYENIALQSELALIDVKTRRQLSSLQLIKALGGGWLNPVSAN